MPNINIDDAFILGETGEQVDKVTGLFTKDEGTTSGEKAFAQLNIGTAGSNRNLLDNPWWGSGEVVNQRGVTQSDGSGGYKIDRWSFSSSLVWSLSADGLSLSTSSNGFVLCYFQDVTRFNGKTLTMSIMLADGTVHSGTITRENGTTQIPIVKTINGAEVNVGLYSDNSFRVRIYSGGTIIIRAVKVELGSVSTLANDAPPDYGEELAKCQYYFVRLNLRSYRCPSNGIATSATEVFFDINVPTNMRDVIPTLAITGTLYAVRNGSTAAITSLAAQNSVRGTYLSLKGTTTGLTALTGVPIYTAANNVVLDISADL